MNQGYFGWLRRMVSRATYWLLHPGELAPFPAYMREVDPGASTQDLRLIRREARYGIETAAAATGLQPQQTLAEALGNRQAPAGAVQVWMRYEVVTAGGRREWRTFVGGRGTDDDPQITWETTVAEIRSRADALEASRDRDSEPAQIDWSTAEFEPPLRYPPA